jgi:hypothetical protein
MRKFILSGIAALGFLTIGLTVFGQVEHHTPVAMIENDRTTRPLLVAMQLFAPSDTGNG